MSSHRIIWIITGVVVLITALVIAGANCASVLVMMVSSAELEIFGCAKAEPDSGINVIQETILVSFFIKHEASEI